MKRALQAKIGSLAHSGAVNVCREEEVDQGGPPYSTLAHYHEHFLTLTFITLTKTTENILILAFKAFVPYLTSALET